MNIVSHDTSITRQRVQPSVTLPAARPPIYVRLMLIVLTCVIVLTAGWATLFRQDVTASNPLSNYVEILPGQRWNATLAGRFSCNADNSFGESQYCTRAPADGPFSLVTVIVLDGVVSRVDFSVREGALTIGDLALLWDRPSIQFYRKSVNLEWRNMNVTASAWAESGRFSYSIPVIRLAFGSPVSISP